DGRGELRRAQRPVRARLERITQDSSLPAPGLAAPRELRRDADPAREQLDLGGIDQAGLLDQLHPRIPTLRVVGVLEARIPELAADVFEHLLRIELDRQSADPT